MRFTVVDGFTWNHARPLESREVGDEIYRDCVVNQKGVITGPFIMVNFFRIEIDSFLYLRQNSRFIKIAFRDSAVPLLWSDVQDFLEQWSWEFWVAGGFIFELMARNRLSFADSLPQINFYALWFHAATEQGLIDPIIAIIICGWSS